MVEKKKLGLSQLPSLILDFIGLGPLPMALSFVRFLLYARRSIQIGRIHYFTSISMTNPLRA